MSARRPSCRRGSPVRAGLVAAAAVVLAATAAGARAPLVDPIPWDALIDDPGVDFHAERFDDSDSGWSADRIGLRITRKAGASSILLLHFDYVSFRTGGSMLLERWPELAGEEASAGWPGESRVSGWVRPGFGLIGRISPPLIGGSNFALGLDLPLGKDSLYPFGGRSIPLRLHLLRPVRLGGGLELSVGAGAVLHVDSPGDELSGDAFGSVTILEGGLSWRSGGRRLRLAFESASGDGVESRALSLTGSIPSGDSGRFRIGVAGDLAGAEDRIWSTRFILGWTIAFPVMERPDPAGETKHLPRAQD